VLKTIIILATYNVNNFAQRVTPIILFYSLQSFSNMKCSLCSYHSFFYIDFQQLKHTIFFVITEAYWKKALSSEN
jgi:hypothetical protein